MSHICPYILHKQQLHKMAHPILLKRKLGPRKLTDNPEMLVPVRCAVWMRA